MLLVMIFNGQWFERAGFFYSHFMLIKSYKGLLVQIYFYDGICESFVYYLRDFVRQDKYELKKYQT